VETRLTSSSPAAPALPVVLTLAFHGAGGPTVGDNPAFLAFAASLGAETHAGRALSWNRELHRALARIAAFRAQHPQGPIHLVGYSAGAHDVIDLANRLGTARIPVAGLVTFDPHRKNFIGLKAYRLLGGNVAAALNLYQRNRVRMENLLSGTNPFRGGPLHGAENLDLTPDPAVVHVTIVRDALRLHREKIYATLGRTPPSPTAG